MAEILVVDDEPTIRRLLELTIDAEHAVATAADGFEALERLRGSPPHLLLLDVAMPGLDGLAVCRAVRAEPALERVGIVVLSAYDRRRDAMAAGADRFLEKPFSPLELLDAIDAVLALRGIGDGPLWRGLAVPAG
jgi:CheY-like chemotaxis protein